MDIEKYTSEMVKPAFKVRGYFCKGRYFVLVRGFKYREVEVINGVVHDVYISKCLLELIGDFDPVKLVVPLCWADDLEDAIFKKDLG